MKRFSIRELLLLFAIVAMALGWGFDRYKGRPRFEMHTTSNHVFVLDSVSGQVWDASISENGTVGRDYNLFDNKLPK